jgi:glycosyltransferase involved in cell wall biosynthesis
MVATRPAFEPEVSVVIPCYNQGRFLAEAVQSALNQGDIPVECLVVDDGSTDDTAQVLDELVKQFGLEKVRALRHPNGENRGVCASRNLALDQAKGKFIGFLDADDAWLPGKLAQQLAVLNRLPSVGLVFGPIRNVKSPERGELMTMEASEESAWNEALETRLEPFSMTEILLSRSVIASPTPLLSREVLGDLRFTVGKVSQKRGVQFEDWLMWLLLSVRVKFYCLAEPLALYRTHGDQHTRTFTNRKRVADHIWGTYEVFKIFLADRAVSAHANWQDFRYQARDTLGRLILRYESTLAWSELVRLAVPLFWSTALLQVLQRKTARQVRAFGRRILLRG